MRRKEAVLVAFLLLGCLGIVLLVFGLMTGPGGAFETPDSMIRGHGEARAPRPAPVGSPPAAATANAPAGGGGRDAAASDPPEQTPPAVPEEPDDVEEEGEAAESAELTLELLRPADRQDLAVEVTVRDQAGEPVADALVVFREGAVLLYRQRTDVTGLATFLPYENEKGPFRVDAIAHGYAPATAEAVAAGAETEITLAARPVVEGEVKAPSRGHGLVRLLQGESERTTKIRADGSFRFDDLDPGRTIVQAEVMPYGAASEEFFLAAGTSRYLRLRIRTRGLAPIFGSISRWPGKGRAWINGAPLPVSPTGTYRFDKAVVGLNEILADAPGRALMRERFHVKALAMSSYNFSLHRDGKVRGRVVNAATNRPVGGAVVRLGFDKGDPRNDRALRFPIDRVPVVETDGDGRFEIDRLDLRLVYILSIVAEGHGQFVGEVVPGLGRGRYSLPEGPFIYGRLRGLGGLPHGAVVTATPIDPSYSQSRSFNVDGWDRARGQRDRKGFYGLSGLLPGSYLVRVDAPNFGSLETVLDLHGEERLRLDLRLRRGQFAEDERDEVELLSRLPPVIAAEGEGPAPEASTVLAVDMRRPHAKPLPGVRIRFFEGDVEFAAPVEYFEDEFDLIGLPEATYRAVLTHPTLTKPIVVEPIVLRRGEPFTLEFR
ncbi:MAG: Ig-like domain-containing protein [Planctomycetota bacterium]|jgi:hypothetical protein